MKDKLFVFDANIIISAVLIPQSKPDLAIRKAQDSGSILMSPEIWAELEQVLARPKFDRYISFAYLLEIYTFYILHNQTKLD